MTQLNSKSIHMILKESELPHQKSKQKNIDASYKNLNEIIFIIV